MSRTRRLSKAWRRVKRVCPKCNGRVLVEWFETASRSGLRFVDHQRRGEKRPCSGSWLVVRLSTDPTP